MDSFLQDLKYAGRMLARRPAFTLIALLSLTLGIGANTTIFTLGKALFLQTVPVKSPESVIVVYANRNNGKLQYVPNSYLNELDYRERNSVFAKFSIFIPNGANLVVSGKEEPLLVGLVNADFFDVLGASPTLGRAFRADEDAGPGAHPVALISSALWRTQFGASSTILGQTIRINAQDYTVVGVMPRDFHDVGVLGSPDVLVPMAMHEQVLVGATKDFFLNRGAGISFGVGRLKPGVTLQQAESNLHSVADELARQYPKENTGRNCDLVPIASTTIPPQQRANFLRAGTLMGVIVGLVLLIACANVANLLLARSIHRQREIAIRQSMGASRSRLLRQLLIESLVLAFCAGALGVGCGYLTRGLATSLLPPNTLPDNVDLSIDGRVLLFTLGLSIFATLLFGLVPALQSTSSDRMVALRDRTDTPGGSIRWYSLRGALVTAQVAFSLVAVMGAGVFIHSLKKAQHIDTGYELTHVLSFFVNLSSDRYPRPRAEQFLRDLIERLRGMPGIENASVNDNPPLARGGARRTAFPEGADMSDPTKGRLAAIHLVEPGFFATSGMTLIRGRDFTNQDTPETSLVAVVNQAAAQQLWPGQDPVGKHVYFQLQTWDVTVVGLVNTVKYQTLGEPPTAIIYFPFRQQFTPAMFVWIRTKVDPRQALATVRSIVQSTDPAVQMQRILTGDDALEQALSAPRFGAELLGGFAVLALALATMGTYGVMSYSVSQRTRELGIRVALGAQRSDVLRLVLGGGMAMVGLGMLTGFGLSFLLTRSVGTLLYGIGLFDAPSFFATALILAAIGLAACFIPARRAASVDPMVALRYE